MPTKRPLVELIPDIVQHYNSYQEYLQFNLRLYRMAEGQVKTEVEDSLRQEILSQSALRRALQRIPAINVLKKAVDKLSKVYMESPLRLTNEDADKEIMANIVRDSGLDNVMRDANRILNVHHTFALEPFVENGKHKVRALWAHQFLPFSDNVENPLQMTVFIKLLGNDIKYIEQVGNDKGKRKEAKKEIRMVNILGLYSDQEFLIIDSDGAIREDKMLEMGITSSVNPFGVIPFIIGTRSNSELVPFPNQSAFDITILIPKLLTDLNYASQFMSHSIIWTKNANLEGQEINPDAIVDLGDKTEANGEPEIGTIDPKVDIDRILKLVEFEMSSYFSTIGIKTSVSGSLSPGKEESGVSKAIDEGDTTAERKNQTEFFREIEQKFWNLMSKVHSIWSKEGRLVEGERKLFTDKFVDTFRIKYAEAKTLKSHNQLLEEIKTARELKLMSRRQALRLLNPDYTEDQISEILKEVDDEIENEMDMMIGSNDDGQFKPGNDKSADQSDSEGKLKNNGQ